VFCEEGNQGVRVLVNERFKEILRVRASHVAAGIRRSATLPQTHNEARKPADTCAGYLIHTAASCHYDAYLAPDCPSRPA